MVTSVFGQSNIVTTVRAAHNQLSFVSLSPVSLEHLYKAFVILIELAVRYGLRLEARLQRNKAIPGQHCK
jgi:hypothetical protein